MAICHCETLILYLLSSRRALWYVITQAGMMSKFRKWHLREPKFAKFPGGACPRTPLEARAFGANNYSLFSITWGWNLCYHQDAKKVIFKACHSGKLKLTFISPNIISTNPKNVLMSRLISQFFSNLNSSKNFTCPSRKLITEFTRKKSTIAQSYATFFAR